jgi:hypothetical protein
LFRNRDTNIYTEDIIFYFEHSLAPITFTPFPHHKMLRKAMVGMAIVGLSAVDAYSVLQKRDGAGGHHDHAHEAPAPASGYDEPAAAYGAPAASYGAPAASYGAPAASYAEPAASYDAAPSYGAEEAALPDLTPIIIGILALVGLSLLFPTFVSVSARKKRSAAEDANPMTDVVERVNEIYNSVIQSEQCMERIACELGGIAGDVGLKESPMAKMADLFVTAKYKPYYKQFKSGQNCEKIKCGSLPF